VSDLRPPPAPHGGCFKVATKADIPCLDYHISLNPTLDGSGSGTFLGRCVLYRRVKGCFPPPTRDRMVKKQRRRKGKK
jgi:hypothetical protein